ncbi:MAG: TIGR03790 family protein [Phycisphaerales bacterium]
MTNRRLRQVARVLPAAIAVCAGSAAHAGGTPENILLIIDPTVPASLHIGAYYKQARQIPDSHVLYMRSEAASYAEFRDQIQQAFSGTLAHRGIASKIDYVVLAPTDVFFVPAPNLITDSCWPVARFSITSAYTFTQFSSSIVPNTSFSAPNAFYSLSDAPTSFSSTQGYINGVPNASGSARRFYIASLLGYTGPFGNSTQQLMSMIDRSAAVDGTRPAGRFYYMNTTIDPRNVRQPDFAAAVSALAARGALAEQLVGSLPNGRDDALGIMTGVADLNVAAANVTILPGAFADHLTSYAATFDVPFQTKLTHWIGSGASGSCGTVEEPCAYPGKFPHPRFHVWYFQGMSLGECYLRGQQYLPFQNLLYGDPMTRPFARLPIVSVTNAPAQPVTGTVTLSTSSQPTAPGAVVSTLELLVDGVPRGLIAPSITNSFPLDTRTLDDGWHDLRVLARDSTTVRNIGRWVGSIVVNNHGRSASLGVSPLFGDLAQAYTFTPGAGGGQVRHVHLLHNDRIIAASDGLAPITVFGTNLGAGASKLIAEVTFADGRIARSAPTQVNVGNSGIPGSAAPTVFSIHKRLLQPATHVVELPAVFPNPLGSANTFALLNSPAQATVLNPSFTGPYRFIRPNAGASGQETLQYRVTTPGGQSQIGTVTLHYSAPQVCSADFNVDGTLNADDLGDYINAFFDHSVPRGPEVDFNQDGSLDADDLGDYINAYFAGDSACV